MNALTHVLVIPDGNRRYAKEKNIDTKVVYQHISEFTTTELIKFICITKKIKEFSIFGISRNNVLLRSNDELNELFTTQAYLTEIWQKDKSLKKAKIKFKLVGDLELLPKKHLNKIMELEKNTKNNSGPLVNLLVAYDGQWEILKLIKNDNALKKIEKIEDIYKKLLIKTPIDLIIRTGKEKRFSAAPLFQTSYAEMYFTDYYYPELTTEKLEHIFSDYKTRQIREGK